MNKVRFIKVLLWGLLGQICPVPINAHEVSFVPRFYVFVADLLGFHSICLVRYLRDAGILNKAPAYNQNPFNLGALKNSYRTLRRGDLRRFDKDLFWVLKPAFPYRGGGN
jgi:hypothetical protein